MPLRWGWTPSRSAGWFNGQPSVLLVINKQANSNVIETVDAVRRRAPAVTVDIVDAAGHRTPARVSVTASDGRAYAPRDA